MPTPLVVLAHFLEVGLSVSHAGCCLFLHEMFGKEEPAAMIVIDFQHEDRPVVRCLLGPSWFQEPAHHIGAKSPRKTHLPCPGGRLSQLGWAAPKWGKTRVCHGLVGRSPPSRSSSF